MNNERMKIALGFLVGAATGAAIGLLMAPAKGSDTRKKIQGKLDHATEDIMDSASRYVGKAKEQYNTSVQKAAKSTKKGIDTLQSKVTVN